ncbi:MAG: FGGY-family carbohydrate kinase [Propionibacteriaceae bacterium]|jgi:sugar (pentulose or hexulose) kinase|nr:FGGY-family carbohydrate kinase [Propionibacteriaceae bacterium]
MDASQAIISGQAVLGIELGSTRIKAVLVGPDHEVLATGGSEWENEFVDRLWTYSLDAVWAGLREAYAEVTADVATRYGVELASVKAMGFSAMMHGYLAFDAAGQLLVPFRTWRNTNTGAASAELTAALGYNIPLRWSVAHLYQAILDKEEHLPRLDFFTTLAGYVHWQLTGEKVLGVGDASGMFPIDPATGDWDADRLAKFQQLAADKGFSCDARALLPRVVPAGAAAGTLTEAGARLLDPTGKLVAGIPLAPPEGDAGTGMVATNSIAPRTGNVSAGTSIFAMVVLERPLQAVHEELDLVTTPVGDLVAMVHCNNGASELGTWAGVFGEFAAALGTPAAPGKVFDALFLASLDGEADCGGLLAYNYLSGEPIARLREGRPLFTRTPDSEFNLANFMRAQLFATFATLRLGMDILLKEEHAAVDAMFAHGGVFKTKGVAQRYLAAAFNAPVTVGETAGEGGAWGMAVLSAYLAYGQGTTLADYLNQRVFAAAETETLAPDPADVAGFDAYVDKYVAGLAIEAAAVEAL